MTSGPVIIGAGLAGLMTAINLSPAPCTVLSTGELGTETATGWAQGGIAAAFGQDDSAELHAADTISAGDGLCDVDVVAAITAAAPAAVERLTALGADFDRTDDGTLQLGLEGAHSRHRIVRAGGDGSGAEILRAAVEAAKATESITVLQHTRAVRLVTSPTTVEGERGMGRVIGVEVEHNDRLSLLPTTAAVLATGGYGALWLHTSNPLGARGQGLAIAARAGALLRDLEMAQFHPTSLHAGLDPMPLVSEAVRGEGAVLIDDQGALLPCDNLASRDIVSRAVWAELTAGGRVFLDARGALGQNFQSEFPGIDAVCKSVGIDPATQPIPVHPAAHYQCGGVYVDRHGRSSVPGLWAVGEVASTGLHGANRLASNSLLEAVVCAGWVAEDISALGVGGSHFESLTRAASGFEAGATVADRDATSRPPHESDASRLALRTLLTTAAGVVRSEESLAQAAAELTDSASRAGVDLAGGGLTSGDLASLSHLSDHELMALLITQSARARKESRGGHVRSDFPDRLPLARHTRIHACDLLALDRNAA